MNDFNFHSNKLPATLLGPPEHSFIKFIRYGCFTGFNDGALLALLSHDARPGHTCKTHVGEVRLNFLHGVKEDQRTYLLEFLRRVVFRTFRIVDEGRLNEERGTVE